MVVLYSEIASRKHIEAIDGVIMEALKQANVTLQDIDAIAVTYGPGLVGALLVGLAEAKALSFCTQKAIDRCTSYRRTYLCQLYRK